MASRKNGVCFKSFDEALAEHPKTYGRIDLLCAGWPCQDNSIAGKRAGHKGDKSGLYIHFERCLRLFMPRWFIGENVPGFLSVNEGKDFFTVIASLQEIGYGVSWRILDSQYFGVAQRRRRLFIVGYFGQPCPPEILFEQEGSSRNTKTDNEIRTVGLCISTRDGERQDPSTENLVASVVMATDYRRIPCGQFENEGNLVAKPLLASENKLRGIQSDGGNFIAGKITSSTRGVAGRLWEETHIAETDCERERETSGISDELVAPKGIVIGNAVTVNVAEWIGKRIIRYEQQHGWRE